MKVTVQLKPQFVDSRFLLLNDLSDDLQHDPGLGDIYRGMQIGKDSTNDICFVWLRFHLFSGLGKASFFNSFPQNALFICGKSCEQV